MGGDSPLLLCQKNMHQIPSTQNKKVSKILLLLKTLPQYQSISCLATAHKNHSQPSRQGTWHWTSLSTPGVSQQGPATMWVCPGRSTPDFFGRWSSLGDPYRCINTVLLGWWLAQQNNEGSFDPRDFDHNMVENGSKYNSKIHAHSNWNRTC